MVSFSAKMTSASVPTAAMDSATIVCQNRIIAGSFVKNTFLYVLFVGLIGALIAFPIVVVVIRSSVMIA